MEEVASLLVDGFLESPLRDGISRHVADPPSRDVILGKGINKSFANFGGICYLSGRRWLSRISVKEPILDHAHHQASTGILTVELPGASETLVTRFGCLSRIVSGSRMLSSLEASA